MPWTAAWSLLSSLSRVASCWDWLVSAVYWLLSRRMGSEAMATERLMAFWKSWE
jgi:hypothetical protein